MKVTPLEIRQKAFEKQFRGYDTNEVNAFLLSLSQEWERLMDETKEFKVKLEASEKEVTKLREVENSLFKTLKTAEDTGANVVEQARQAAELHLKEAQLNAEAILSEARTKAKVTTEEAEKHARDILSEMELRSRKMADACNKLESQRDTLLSELRHIADDILERVAKVKRPVQADVDMDQQIRTIHEEMDKLFKKNGQSAEASAKTAGTGPAAGEHMAHEPHGQEAPAASSSPSRGEMPEKHHVSVEMEEETVSSRPSKSFFDEIG